MCLQNERVYSLLVSLENECVYSFHVYLSTYGSLQLKTSGMFMRTGLRAACLGARRQGAAVCHSGMSEANLG